MAWPTLKRKKQRHVCPSDSSWAPPFETRTMSRTGDSPKLEDPRLHFIFPEIVVGNLCVAYFFCHVRILGSPWRHIYLHDRVVWPTLPSQPSCLFTVDFPLFFWGQRSWLLTSNLILIIIKINQLCLLCKRNLVPSFSLVHRKWRSKVIERNFKNQIKRILKSAQWFIPLILVRRLRKEDCCEFRASVQGYDSEFQASLGYRGRPCLKQKNKI